MSVLVTAPSGGVEWKCQVRSGKNLKHMMLPESALLL